jgi:predicted PurR-regulated permease PerM
VAPLQNRAALQVIVTTLAAAVAAWVLRIVEDYLVYPRLIRHGIHLHPLAVIVAVLAGLELGGVAVESVVQHDAQQ